MQAMPRSFLILLLMCNQLWQFRILSPPCTQKYIIIYISIKIRYMYIFKKKKHAWPETVLSKVNPTICLSLIKRQNIRWQMSKVRSSIEFYCSVRVFHVANSLIPDLGRNTRALRFDVAIAKKTSRYKIQPKNYLQRKCIRFRYIAMMITKKHKAFCQVKQRISTHVTEQTLDLSQHSCLLSMHEYLWQGPRRKASTVRNQHLWHLSAQRQSYLGETIGQMVQHGHCPWFLRGPRNNPVKTHILHLAGSKYCV